MSESAPLPGPLQGFLDRAADSLLLVGGTPALEPQQRSRVGCLFDDVAALRSSETDPGLLSAVIGVMLVAGEGASSLVPRPEWPPLKQLRSRSHGAGLWTVLRFARPVDVASVLHELGLQAVWPDRADTWPVSELRSGDTVAVRALPGTHALGPIDERLFNPTGFGPAAAPLVSLDTVDVRRGVGPELVRALRPCAGVRVEDWDEAAVPGILRLAMAGVPVVGDDPPAPVRVLLGEPVATALAAPVDLDDPLAREEHSIVLRRAALDTFSSLAWRTALGRVSGVPVGSAPSVSIVLATRRPEMLDFALAQVARQRGVASLELVLASHGFEVTEDRVRRGAGPAVALEVVAQPERTPFGDVLHAAAQRAGGDVVLKMDDDDWYGPDVVADLLRARRYSGAELVGMPPEQHYLTEPDLTVRRGHPAELYTRFVAGGTMLVGRDVLREVGGFRSVRKYVDAQLIEGVLAAGGAVYRTHGLGYVLRRNPTGHTWQVDLDYLLDPKRTIATWPGFRPSRLLEAGP